MALLVAKIAPRLKRSSGDQQIQGTDQSATSFQIDSDASGFERCFAIEWDLSDASEEVGYNFSPPRVGGLKRAIFDFINDNAWNGDLFGIGLLQPGNNPWVSTKIVDEGIGV